MNWTVLIFRDTPINIIHILLLYFAHFFDIVHFWRSPSGDCELFDDTVIPSLRMCI